MKYRFKILYQYGSGIPSNTNTLNISESTVDENIFEITEGTLIKVLDKNITKVIIPNNVIKIGNYAFSFTKLKEVIIPDSVTTIGWGAFNNCLNLTSVRIGNNVETISYNAFGECVNLTNVTIGDSVKTIGRNAFENTSITEVDIPDSVKTIGHYAFYKCSSLTSVRIGDSVETIGDYAFFGTSLTQVVIPDSVITIGWGAFRPFRKNSISPLIEVTIGNNVRTIGEEAFKECVNLTNVTIGNKVETIGNFAFANTSLAEVDIPDSVITIDKGAFSFCSSLTSVRIGDNVRTIGDEAFKECKNLTNVTIGDKVETIGNFAFANTSLAEVDIPDSVITIDKGVFSFCSSLTSVRIGDNVRTIGEEAFANTSLAEVDIPDSVITISPFAFFLCSSLTSVKIGNKVEIIFWGAFKECKNLTNVTIGDKVETIYDEAFAYTSLTQVIIPDSVITIGDWVFLSTDLTEVVIPDSVITISYGAFEDCKNLTSVKIGNKVETIGDNAFNKTSLTQVYIPHSVINIGNFAFDENVELHFNQIDYFLARLGIYDRKETFEINRNFVYDSIYDNYEIFDNDIYVKFSDEDGIDCGGLKNDFFHLLSKYIFNNFMKEDNNYCIIKNDNNYDVENYFYIGKLFAYAIKVRANIEIRLHPLLLHMLINSTDVEIYEDKTSLYKLNQIPGILQNINIEEKIQYELDYQYHWNNLEYDINRIRTILNDYDSQLLEEGIISSSLNLINTKKEDWTYLINTLCLDELDYICENNSENEIEIPYENRELLVELKIKSYLYNKKSEETTAFIKGFHSIIDPTLLEDISMKDLNLLIAGNNNIEVNLFLDNLEFENVNDEQLNLIKNIITEYAEEDNNYLNEFLFWITNKKTLSHNGYEDFGNKLLVKFVPENDIKKSFTIENEEGILVQRDQIEIGSHTCTDLVYTEVPNTWLIDDDNGTAESKLRTGFSKVMIISYSDGKFTSAGGA
jgi:hypothetical protein